MAATYGRELDFSVLSLHGLGGLALQMIGEEQVTAGGTLSTVDPNQGLAGVSHFGGSKM